MPSPPTHTHTKVGFNGPLIFLALKAQTATLNPANLFVLPYIFLPEICERKAETAHVLFHAHSFLCFVFFFAWIKFFGEHYLTVKAGFPTSGGRIFFLSSKRGRWGTKSMRKEGGLVWRGYKRLETVSSSCLLAVR